MRGIERRRYTPEMHADALARYPYPFAGHMVLSYEERAENRYAHLNRIARMLVNVSIVIPDDIQNVNANALFLRTQAT